jgi:hypothetical protein
MSIDREDYRGAVYIADTTAQTGPFIAIQALAAAVIDGGTGGTASGDLLGTLDDMPIPVSAMIFGTFSTVKLKSGKVIAYRM